MTHAQAPAVSVLIPVYMGEKLIGRTLDSLAAQRFTDFEVLCIDDHSPDCSAAVIQARARTDPRIRYLRTAANQGIVPKVLNSVREQVRGRFFVYSSQDDYFSEDWLEKMVARMAVDDVDAVVPNLEFVASDGRTTRKLSGWDRNGESLISGKEAFLLSLDWTIPGNALWKTEFLKTHGFFDFGMYADEYTARVYFLNCRQVAFCDGTFFYFQGNPDAITKKVSASRLDYPYNQFRVWQLVHDHLPGSEHGPRMARAAARDLLEGLVLAASREELAGERQRLRPAIEGMNCPEFREDLRRAFSLAEKPRQIAARSLIRSALVRSFAPPVLALSRRLRNAPPA